MEKKKARTFKRFGRKCVVIPRNKKKGVMSYLLNKP